jgi:Protein of unknown function (DUF3489)
VGDRNEVRRLRCRIFEIESTEDAALLTGIANFGDIALLGQRRLWSLLTQRPQHVTADMCPYWQGRAHSIHQRLDGFEIVDHGASFEVAILLGFPGLHRTEQRRYGNCQIVRIYFVRSVEFFQEIQVSTGLGGETERYCEVKEGRTGSMGRPARAGALPGLGAVGTPRERRDVETMETTMTNRIRQPQKTETPGAAKTKTAARRGRRRPKTKKDIALALLERPKGASLGEMQRAMGWQEHSVRGFLAATVKKMPGMSLTSEKPENGPRRYHVVHAGE